MNATGVTGFSPRSVSNPQVTSVSLPCVARQPSGYCAAFRGWVRHRLPILINLKTAVETG